MALSRLTGVILNRRNIGTVDRRIVVFSPDGKHEFRARGTQKIESKLAGSLEPLTLVEVTYVRGRAGMILTSSRIEDGYSGIRNNLARLAGAGVLLNAAESLVHGHLNDPPAFGRFREALDLLTKSRTNREIFLAVAYGCWNILSELGYRPTRDRLRVAAPVWRTIGILLERHPARVRRIRCLVGTARQAAVAAIEAVELAAERPLAGTPFFRSILDSRRAAE